MEEENPFESCFKTSLGKRTKYFPSAKYQHGFHHTQRFKNTCSVFIKVVLKVLKLLFNERDIFRVPIIFPSDGVL